MNIIIQVLSITSMALCALMAHEERMFPFCKACKPNGRAKRKHFFSSIVICNVHGKLHGIETETE